MPIVPPRLDDRSFDDLLEELLARIPAHTPEWTDVRVGDPGRALLELFAWLGDTLLYRANLVPERQRLRFLELLGRPLRAAVPARGLVSLRLAQPERQPTPIVLRPRARLSGPPDFETTNEVTVHPLDGVAYAKRALTSAERSRLGRALGELGVLYDLQPGQSAEPYATEELFPGGRPRPAGFDFARDPVDRTLWIALLAPKGADVADTRARALALRDELRRGSNGRPYLLDVGLAPALAPVERLEDLPRRQKLQLEWAVTQVGAGAPPFARLDVADDGTSGLLRDGVVRLVLSARDLGAPSNDVVENLGAGVGALPPRIDDPAQAARLVAWVRARPPAGTSSLALAWVGINAVKIEQSVTLESVIVGAGTGRADHVVKLPMPGVDPATLALLVEEDGDGGAAFMPWTVVPDLASSGPLDRHCVLDAEGGLVRFGDGMNGRVPALGRRIRVAHLRAGGGRAGNLPAETLKAVTAVLPGGGAPPPLVAWQPLPLTGGEDAETIERAEKRIPAELRHRDRAVTESDFVELAQRAPGARVGRVEVLPRFLPHQRRSGVPGVVSVMALPAATGFPRAPNPRADRPLIEAVFDWLDARRALGTELYVIGTEYVPLALAIGVELRSGVEREETLLEVRRALEVFLWPLEPGGPEGRGWPLGGAVLVRELEVVVARVLGVRVVNGVRLFGRANGAWREQPSVTLEAWQLPELLEVVVVEGAAPSDPTLLPDPQLDDRVPVPVVPEVC